MSSNFTQKLKIINQALKNLNKYISIIENNKKKITTYKNDNKNLVNLNISLLDKKRKQLLNLDKIYRLKLDNQKQNQLINSLVKNYENAHRVVINGGNTKEELEEIEEEQILIKSNIAKKYNNFQNFILKSQLEYNTNN
tara:strand:+ start:484 stop:900 length:417 start_codon:yes stop_codon:yes gene_type:complete